MNLRVLGIILTITGILAIAVTLTRGANLAISRRAALVSGVVLLVVGLGLEIYAITVAQ